MEKDTPLEQLTAAIRTIMLEGLGKSAAYPGDEEAASGLEQKIPLGDHAGCIRSLRRGSGEHRQGALRRPSRRRACPRHQEADSRHGLRRCQLQAQALHGPCRRHRCPSRCSHRPRPFRKDHAGAGIGARLARCADLIPARCGHRGPYGAVRGLEGCRDGMHAQVRMRMRSRRLHTLEAEIRARKPVSLARGAQRPQEARGTPECVLSTRREQKGLRW